MFSGYGVTTLLNICIEVAGQYNPLIGLLLAYALAQRGINLALGLFKN